MKTIALITTSYPFANDGSEAAGSFVRDFAEELARMARVIVLAPGETDGSIREERGFKVVRYASTRKPLVLLTVRNPRHWLSIARVLRAGARCLDTIALDEKIDHVFALWALPSGYWAWRLKRRKGVPFSIWALGSDIWSLGRIPVVRRVLAGVLKESETNFADGYQLCEDVTGLSGRCCTFLPSTRRLAVPGEIAQQARSSHSRRLAFLGRWHRNKGVDLLLESLLALDEADWERIEEIRINGGGPMEDLVREAVRELQGRGRNVRLGGYLDKNGAARLIQWADYVLIPSRIESIPVVFSDAMKVGRPVLSTPVGDLERLIKEYRCGLAAEACNSEAFAQLLRTGIRRETHEFEQGVMLAAAEFSLSVIVNRFYSSI